VHRKNCFIYCQLWALGRVAEEDVLRRDGFSVVSASPITLPEHATPRPLTKLDIQNYTSMYATAARNAMRAGFDGVEIHGANGYLIDQFLQDVTNNRMDEYGGSIEKRCRFALEIVDACVEAIGAERVAFKLSPWGIFYGKFLIKSGSVTKMNANHVIDMRMTDPIPTFNYLVSELKKRHPNLAFLHVAEPGLNNLFSDHVDLTGSNDFVREIWSPRPLISCGGYNRSSGLTTAEEKGDLIAYGRLFLTNVSLLYASTRYRRRLTETLKPDLPYRLEQGVELAPKADMSIYFSPNDPSPKNYTDFPFAPTT
jgi:NADPH2 dehydrogenase